MTSTIASRPFLSLVILTMVVTHASSMHCGAAPTLDERQEKKWDALIDAMASRNASPKLEKVGTVTLPVFLPNFDWKEQDRVRKALVAVAREDSPDLWAPWIRRR